MYQLNHYDWQTSHGYNEKDNQTNQLRKDHLRFQMSENKLKALSRHCRFSKKKEIKTNAWRELQTHVFRYFVKLKAKLKFTI